MVGKNIHVMCFDWPRLLATPSAKSLGHDWLSIVHCLLVKLLFYTPIDTWAVL